MRIMDLLSKIDEVFTNTNIEHVELKAETCVEGVETLGKMISDYNSILNGYKNYIKALEQEEPIKQVMLKIMSCNGEKGALENIKTLTIGLSILGKKIIKAGHKFSKSEAEDGIKIPVSLGKTG